MEHLLYEFFLIALIATAVTLICNKIKIPPIVGFLITGALLGPTAIGLVEDKEAVDTLSEVGVVLLLFTIGMEISIGELIRLKKPVFLGGTIQVAATIGIFWFLAQWGWGSETGPAIFIGFLMTLSSTAIVLKTLQEKAMMDAPPGRISLSILIYQDLIIVPMMLAIPLLAGDTNSDASMLELASKAAQTLLLVIVFFLVARKAIPYLLRIIIGTRSREVFLISILGICLGTAVLTSALGLSLSLGAFMAGLIVAESEYSHNALEGILPFKDVFSSVFFISVGMLLNVDFFASHFGSILVITLCVLILKALVTGIDTRIIGYPLRTAIVVGLALCQVGEFSFVLAKEGLDHGLLSNDLYQLFLAASILTMVLTPFLISGAPALAARLVKSGKSELSQKKQSEDGDGHIELSDHLIILGFGIGGKLLARAAKMAGIRYVILEMNPDTVRQYKAKGEPIYYGDAVHEEVLNHLGITRARILAIVISDPAAVRAVTQIARHMNGHLHILARTRYLSEVDPLQKLGASDVIPEEYETAMEVFIRVLTKYLVPRDEIEKFTHEVRAENYEMLRRVELPTENLESLACQIPDLTVLALKVAEYSALVGKSLLESELRKESGATVVAVKRGDEMITNPDGNFSFKAEDVAYLFSTPECADTVEKYFSGK